MLFVRNEVGLRTGPSPSLSFERIPKAHMSVLTLKTKGLLSMDDMQDSFQGDQTGPAVEPTHLEPNPHFFDSWVRLMPSNGPLPSTGPRVSSSAARGGHRGSRRQSPIVPSLIGQTQLKTNLFGRWFRVLYDALAASKSIHGRRNFAWSIGRDYREPRIEC